MNEGERDGGEIVLKNAGWAGIQSYACRETMYVLELAALTIQPS